MDRSIRIGEKLSLCVVFLRLLLQVLGLVVMVLLMIFAEFVAGCSSQHGVPF